MPSSGGFELLVVSSNLASTMKTLSKKSGFPYASNLVNTLPGPPEIGDRELVARRPVIFRVYVYMYHGYVPGIISLQVIREVIPQC